MISKRSAIPRFSAGSASKGLLPSRAQRPTLVGPNTLETTEYVLATLVRLLSWMRDSTIKSALSPIRVTCDNAARRCTDANQITGHHTVTLLPVVICNRALKIETFQGGRGFDKKIVRFSHC